MAPLAEAFVRIRPDTSTFKSDLEKQVSKADPSGSAHKTGSKWGAVFGKAAGAFAGIGIAKFATDSVSAFKEAQVAQNQLSDAFSKFPKLADSNIQAFQDLNSQLATKTKFDDDATASGQAVLAQFKLTGSQILQLTPLLQDYAAKTGKDLPTAAKDLGKAMLGQGRGLKAIGLNFKDTGTASGNFSEIMSGLRTQVGGFAEKEGKTGAGQAEILKNQFGELQEAVGAKLLPALVKLASTLQSGLAFIQRNAQIIGPLVAVVGGLAAAIYGLIVAQRLQAFVTKQQTEQTIIYTVVSKAAAAASKVWTVATYLLGAAMKFALGPVGLIIAAAAVLVGGIIYLATKTQFFQTLWRVSWGAIKKAFDATFNWIKSHWPLILAILTGPFGIAVGLIIKHWDKIKNGGLAVLNWVKRNWPLLLALLTGPIGLAAIAIIKNWDKIKEGVSRVFGAILKYFRDLPGQIRGFFASAKTWLYNYGRDVLNGFWDGLKAVWKKITGWISGLTGWIKEHKGPPAFDRNLLVQAGKDIMTGFFNGLKNGGLRALGFVQDIAGNIRSALGGTQSTASGAMQKMVAGYASALYGWTGSEWTALRALIMGESGFNPNAQNPTSSAYGLFQFLDSTWGYVNATKTSNPQMQTLAGLRYIKKVYGDPINAFSAWLNRSPHWYGSGLAPTVFSRPTLIGVGERGPETVSVTPASRGHADQPIIVQVTLDGRVLAQATAIRLATAGNKGRGR